MAYVVFNQTKIYYEVHGRGEPILFLHGWNESMESFKYNILGKFNSDYQFILLDFPGCGKSEEMELSFDGLSDMIDSLLSKIGITKISIIGYCMGGIIGLDYALKKQEKVNKLFLIETFIDFPSVLTLLLIRGVNYRIIKFLLNNRIGFNIVRNLIFLKEYKYREEYLMMLKNTNLMVSLKYIDLMWRYSKIDHYKRMEKMENVVIIISGRCTRKEYIKMIKKVHNSINNSVFIQLDKVGHFPIEEGGEKIVNIINAYW